MFKPMTRWMTTAVLVAGMLTACDGGPGPTEVSLSTSSTETLASGSDLLLEAASSYTRTTGATLVTTTSSALGTVATAVVGSGGGTIGAGDHFLEIPKDAVADATEFRMEVVTGDNVLVALSARRVSTGDPVSMFPVPLTLNLSYKSLGRGTDLKRLRNVYLYLDSPNYLLPLVSTLSKSTKTVSSPVWHFSRYGMAIE